MGLIIKGSIPGVPPFTVWSDGLLNASENANSLGPLEGIKAGGKVFLVHGTVQKELANEWSIKIIP